MKIRKGQFSASVFLSGSNVTSGINYPGTETPSGAPGQDPIVAWATIDAYPYDGSYNSISGTVPVAIVAIDEWIGVSSVTFTFSESVAVGASTSTVHTVSESSWVDVHGTGRSGEYWVCPITKASVDANGNTVNVTGVTITRTDATTFDAHEKIGSRVINTKLASETIKTVRTSGGDYASVQAALNGSTSSDRGNSSCFDRVQIESGTWDITAKLIPFATARTAPIILEPLDPEDPPTLRIASTQNIDDWIVVEGCVIKQDYTTLDPVDIYLVGHHIGFKNCTFDRGVAGADYGSVLANNDNSMRHEWFCGCNFIGGHRGIVTGRRISLAGEANGYSHDMIISNCTFTGMGSCLRIEWDRCLVEYVVAYNNVKEPFIGGAKPVSRGWDPLQHFNFINTGNGSLDNGATTLDSVVIRGIVSSNNGTEANNYAGMQLYGKANNYAFIDFVSYGYQKSQQVFYTTQNSAQGGTQLSNIQMCGLVIGAQDWADDGLDRGIAFNYTDNPQTTFSNMLLQNSLANRIITSDLDNTDDFTIRNYKTAIATGPGQDDEFQTDDATPDFTNSGGNIVMDELVTLQDPTPKSGSLLEAAGGTRNRRYDLYGNEWNSSSTIGAVETQ